MTTQPPAVEMCQLLRERSQCQEAWARAADWKVRDAASKRLAEIRARLHALGFHGLA